jgi:hypothetical protein
MTPSSRTLLCLILAIVAALCVHIEAIPIGLLATDWKKCGQGEWKLQNVTLGPQHITPGTTARFVINAVSGNIDVQAGHITMLVRLSGLPIYTQQDDLCSKTSCPIQSGAETKVAYEVRANAATPCHAYVLEVPLKCAPATRRVHQKLPYIVKCSKTFLSIHHLRNTASRYRVKARKVLLSFAWRSRLKWNRLPLYL